MGGVENEYIYIMVLAAFDESLNDGKMLWTATKLSQWMRHGLSKKLLHGHAIIKSTLADVRPGKSCAYVSI